MTASDRPRLLIVSGAPATGKSTLARILATRLGLPYFGKDELKEAIADKVGPPADVAASQRLGHAAYKVLFLMSARVLEAGSGLVVESNFRRGRSEPELRPLVALADARLVHCSAHAEAVRRRYDERHRRGERHPAHLDADRAGDLATDLETGLFEPLELGIPSLTVHTDEGYEPALDAVLAFAGGAQATSALPLATAGGQ
ncbi:MAG TPA: AAA family ATPase [Solirubrobacter sp.]|nr:AAA family ATPase [Solirubrobacter sp.]